MSFDPKVNLNDNYDFIVNNKNTDLGHIDVASDGHLIKVTWLNWVIRWIVNTLWSGSVDQKVYNVFCVVIRDKFPEESQPPMAALTSLAIRVQYIDSLLSLVSDEGSPDGEIEVGAPDKAAEANDKPFLMLDLAKMAKTLEEEGVSLFSTGENNVKRFYDVLVEFTKSNSFDSVIAKAFEVLSGENSSIPFSRPVLRGALLKNLESKIEADLTFFNLLDVGTQKVVEGFKNGLEEQNKQKLEEERKALEGEAKMKADEEAEAKMREETEAKREAEENLRVAEEKGYILDISLMDLKELVESREKIDCKKLISMLDNVWEIIQNYPKEIGIPANTAEVFAKIVNDLTVHISTLNRNKHPVKLLEDTWNKIVDYLGVDARIIIDDSLAIANTPVRAFAQEYLQKKLQAEYGMNGAILDANISKMEEIVERVVVATDSTDPLDILSEIVKAIDFCLVIDKNEFILKYVESNVK